MSHKIPLRWNSLVVASLVWTGPQEKQIAFSNRFQAENEPPLVINSSNAVNGFHVDGVKGQDEELKGESMSIKADSLTLPPPLSLSASREANVDPVLARDAIKSYSTSALPTADNMAGGTQKSVRKAEKLSKSINLSRKENHAAVEAQMGDDYDWLGDEDELAMEEELRSMLRSAGSGGDAVGASLSRSTSSISYSGIEREREFLSQTHGIQPKRRGAKEEK